jgi:hypothetical protein
VGVFRLWTGATVIEEPSEPNEDNLIANVFGDELSSKRMAEAMQGPAGETYNQVVSV